jgi:hypothetical protein
MARQKEYKTYDNFDGLTPEEIVIAERIRRLRFQVLIHSCLYYHMDNPSWDDYQFDCVARELSKIQIDNPEISKRVRYYKPFLGFGETGCFSGYSLPYTLPEIQEKANMLIRLKEMNSEH